jgi:hypothetical protein
MFRISPKLKLSQLAVAWVAGLFFCALISCEAMAQDPHVGRIVGNLDGISQDGDHFYISGWACQQGQKKSIAVHVFDAPKNTFIVVQWADLYNESKVADMCQDHRGKHRFVILLPYGYGADSKLDVRGIRAVDGVPNEAIAGSGKKLALLPMPEVPYPSLPPFSGSYHALAEHPRVFTTTVELKDLVARINRSGSYSMERFGLLAGQIRHDLASGIDWDVTYSGCEGRIYQYAFSYEPQDHLEAMMRTSLHVAPNAKYPTGAAVVASRLAFYAGLVKAGATVPPGAPSADDAAGLAKRILLAWANHGFPRDAEGHILPLLSKFCEISEETRGDVTVPGTMVKRELRDTGALGLGRGVLYSVQAQDMLQSFAALNDKEENQLNLFHAGMFDLIRQSLNAFLGAKVFPYPDCARYNNIPTNDVASLLAIGRLLDDEKRFNAVLYGRDSSVIVLIPLNRLFDRIIYGESDTLPACYENRYPDSLTSLQNHSDYQNANVAPGEIADRGRNENPLKGIGYPMFTLERLFDSAETLRNSGFDLYGYRGAHNQSIEMAMQYYACYAKGAGFYKVVTADNSKSCPNAAQYYGKLVSGVDNNVLIGAYRFPKNRLIAELDKPAKTVSSSGGFSTDAILFGKWQD